MIFIYYRRRCQGINGALGGIDPKKQTNTLTFPLYLLPLPFFDVDDEYIIYYIWLMPPMLLVWFGLGGREFLTE